MKLEELEYLSKIITRNKAKHIPMLGDTPQEKSKAEVLYDQLRQGDFRSEEEAIRAFFGDSKYRKHNFSRVKRQLEEKLINTLFFVDLAQSDFSSIQSAYYSCYRYAAAVKILIGRAARKAAIPLAESTLQKAQKFGFTDIIFLMAKELRNHYANMEGNKKKYSQYNKLVEEHLEILVIESRLEAYFSEIVLYLSVSKTVAPELKEKITLYADYAEKQVTKYPYYRLNLFGFNIITLTYQFLNDHEKLMASCERAIQYFDSLDNEISQTANYRYMLRMLPSQIMLGHFDRAEELALRALHLAPTDSYNYFKILEFYLILGFYSQRYEIALKASEMAHAQPVFEEQYAHNSEYWKLYDGFIYLFIQLGKIKVPEDSAPRQFKVGRFLNEVPIYSKDKRGANVTILILQVLLLLQQQKHDKIIDKADALKVYTSRYLRKNETYRSNCFLKMLLLLPYYGFNKKIILKRAARLEKKLSEVKLADISPNLEVEIVPYETLWEIVKELL